MTGVQIRRIPDDEPEREVCIVGGVCPVHQTDQPHYKSDGTLINPPAKPQPALVKPADLDPWSRAVLSIFGSQRGSQILSRRRCVHCQGRLRPYTDPKAGSAANREYGVTPMLRCAKCGRDAS